MLRSVALVLRLQIRLEWLQRQSYFSLLIYVLSTGYLTYLVFGGTMGLKTWNAIFWVIFLFAAVQAAYRSFYFEAERRFLLYYGWVPVRSLILGKMAYHFLYLLLLGLFTAGFLGFLLGPELADWSAFVVIVALASAGFSGVLTFTAGLAAKAGSNPALPAILSIPLLYPQVVTLSRVSNEALTGFSWELNASLLAVLALLGLLSAALALLLFPYLWRD
jgi:heme exporter protein B